MHHVALIDAKHTVQLFVSAALVMAVAGCSTPRSALKPLPDTPAVVYAIPPSQAFAIARKAIVSAASSCGAESVHVDEISRGDGDRGYEANYRSWLYRSSLVRRLYVIRTSGITQGGQPIDGFRFEITYDLYAHREAPWPQRCELSLARTLQTALDATGTGAIVRVNPAISTFRSPTPPAGARSPGG
jgi:hypothetical protein